jgi:N-methylhydantoinase B
VPHKTDSISWVTITSEVAIPGPGLFGGYPSSTNSYLFVKGANAREQAAATGRMPTDPSQLHGEHEWVAAKSFDKAPTPQDVWVFGWAGAAGYGDPLEREPEAVRDDVAAGRVSREWAHRAYGVVLTGPDDQPALDAQATKQRRQEMVAERLEQAKPWAGDAQQEQGGDGPTPPDGQISEYVHVSKGEMFADGVNLGPASGNYKLRALVRDLPLTEANPQVRDPAIYTDSDVKFRQIIAPGTGRLLETEIVVDGAPPQWDLRPGQV